MVQLRSEAGWGQKGLREAAFTGLGLLGDLLKPWMYLLPLMLLIALTVATGSFILWWRQQHLGHLNSPSKRRITASAAMYGLLGSLIFAPLLTVDLATKEPLGAVAGSITALKQLQELMISRLDQTTKSVADLNNLALQQKVEVQKQGKAISAVQDTMDLSVALALVDRARTTRDGSNQGQGLAFQALLARGFDFIQQDLSGISLAGASLDGANFSASALHFLNIDDAKLRAANFTDADLRFATANNTNFSGAKLSNSFAVFFNGRGANFTGAKLQGANFYGADLRRSDFTDADLTGAVLTFANLEGANFTRARLTDSFLAGALLTTANLSEAKMDGADVLGAVRDPGTLSALQRNLICRHQVNDIRFDLRIKERRESNRYSSGYEYENVSSLGDVVSMRAFKDKSLPICSAKPAKANGYSPRYPGELSLFLERSYLKNGNRFAMTSDRIKEFYSQLNTAFANGVFLTGDGQYRHAWIEQMKQRASSDEHEAIPMIDSDAVLVWLLSKGILRAEDIDWPSMARVRLTIERRRAERSELAKGWGDFFPNDAVFDDLPEEAVPLFQEWTRHRASQLPNRLVVQTSSVLSKVEGSTVSRLVVSDGGYIRENLEGYSISTVNPWPQEAIEIVKKFVDSAARARLAPAHVRLANNQCCFNSVLVFPKSFIHYAVTFPDNLNVSEESVLELELVVDGIQRPTAENTALVYVSPREARIRDAQGKVLFSGPLEEGDPTGP